MDEPVRLPVIQDDDVKRAVTQMERLLRGMRLVDPKSFPLYLVCLRAGFQVMLEVIQSNGFRLKVDKVGDTQVVRWSRRTEAPKP